MIILNPQWLFFLNSVPESRGLFSMDAQMFIGMIPNIVSFIVLVVLLTKLLYKPVNKILQTRADRVESEMKDAAENKVVSAELKAEYEQKVRDVEIERASILEKALKQANARRAQILDEVKVEAQEVKDRASRDIATEREQIKGAVHQAIIDISTEMAARFITASIDKKAHDRLFTEALIELEATTAFNTDTVAV